MYPYNYGSACPRWKLLWHSCLNIVSVPEHSYLLIKLCLPRTIPDLFDLETRHSHLPFTSFVGITVPCLFPTAVFNRIMSCSWCGFWVKKLMVLNQSGRGDLSKVHTFLLGSHLEPLPSGCYQFQHQRPHYLQLASPLFSAAISCWLFQSQYFTSGRSLVARVVSE
jgi:hypothetical protein